MKKSNVSKRLLWYVIFFVISLFLVFFVGTKVNSTNGETSPILTTKWLSHLKKWLDLAWGVRLTYKVDFSKYEEAYKTDAIQLTQMKKMALDIILKNVDKRISTLWVSDYSAYVQRLTDGEYIVVEIWWVQDIETAKKMIWKTVELEFKLQNKDNEISESWAKARLDLANSLLVSAKGQPDTMESLWTSKGSEDVTYNLFSDVTVDQLPMIYANNLQALTSIASWAVFDKLLTGTYHIFPIETETWYTQTEVKWYLISRFLGKKELEVDVISEDDVRAFASSRGIKVVETIVKQKPSNTLQYDDAQKNVLFVGDEILPNQAGYDVAIYQMADWADQNKLTNELQNAPGKYSTYPDLTLVASWWKATSDVTTLVSNFMYSPSSKVTAYKELDGTYFVVVHALKDIWQKAFLQIAVPVSGKESADRVIAWLSKKTLYSFEELFVSQTLNWVIAKDPITNEVLNGSYFKYAKVDSSQTGKPVVSIQFDEKGKTIFCNLTEKNVGEQMAIFVGGKIATNAVIREKICGGSAQIDGTFDVTEARKTADELNSGALPAPLLLSHEETIAASLWENALRGALLAGLLGLIIAYVVMTALYGFKKATIAMLGLLSFLVYLLGIMKLFGVVSSLSGIAAVILSVGMAVDANVLIYERMNEELKAGKSMKTAINEWYERSWSSIRDGNITTGIIGLLLFLVWIGVFKWFWTLMVINQIIILIVMVPLTKELLHLFYRTDR